MSSDSLILFFLIPLLTCSSLLAPDPESGAIVQQSQREENASLTIQRRLLDETPPCPTENPFDDCWRCDPNCAIGYGLAALMDWKESQIYKVTDPSDDLENPSPGTLRHAVIQLGAVWIAIHQDMHIYLKGELIVSSSKTIDGRRANVKVTGKGCIVIENEKNVNIIGINVYNCKPSGKAKIRVSPTRVVERGESAGYGVSINGSTSVWIDHVNFTKSKDELVNITGGPTAVKITNSCFDRDYFSVTGVQVTAEFSLVGKQICNFGDNPSPAPRIMPVQVSPENVPGTVPNHRIKPVQVSPFLRTAPRHVSSKGLKIGISVSLGLCVGLGLILSVKCKFQVKLRNFCNCCNNRNTVNEPVTNNQNGVDEPVNDTFGEDIV